MSLLQWAGIIPAIIFPAASLSQLVAIARRRSAEGVSIATWVLVAIANISLFIYTEKYTDIINIIALLGAALLNICVASLAVFYQRQSELALNSK